MVVGSKWETDYIIPKMRESVYLDSTVFSFFFDMRPSLDAWICATKDWWAIERPRYNCWISEAVLLELQEGNYPRKDEVIKLAAEIPVLDTSAEVENVALFYMENYLMPKGLIGDAIHLAHTSYFNIEYLLTWNCNHLANANKKKHIRILNGRLGLPVPEIVTPLELVAEDL